MDNPIYKNNAIQIHYDLDKKIPLQKIHFDTWLSLFTGTIDELFEGRKAELAKTRAKSIATIMQLKMESIHQKNSELMDLRWNINSFNELTPVELYAILKLRSEVFVVEQNCVYLDTDNKDINSYHLAGWFHNDIAAYCRILPPGMSYDSPSIGRVATSFEYRHLGYGKELIKQAISFSLEHFDCKKITIGAQVYLKKFYGSFGFIQTGEIYLEDNIPHIQMQLTA